jgi:hypothetical protein
MKKLLEERKIHAAVTTSEQNQIGGEMAEIMKKFLSGEIQVLCTTTGKHDKWLQKPRKLNEGSKGQYMSHYLYCSSWPRIAYP